MKLISNLSPANCLILEGFRTLLRALVAIFGGLREVASNIATVATRGSKKSLESSEDKTVALPTCKLGLLPETLQATVLEFSGPLTWLHASRTSAEMHRMLWEAPLVWSHALSRVGVDIGNPEREPSCLRASYRRHCFGIDSFCLQPVHGSASFSEVSLDMLRKALRACRGLEVSDGTAIITSVAQQAAGLLRGFEVDDQEAQQEAEALADFVETHEDVFSDEQRIEVACAFKEAMDFKQLMENAMLPLDASLDIDVHMDSEDVWEESGLWSEESTCANEEVLNQLIATLKESCAEGAITM